MEFKTTITLSFKEIELRPGKPDKGICWIPTCEGKHQDYLASIVKTPTTKYCYGYNGKEFETLKEAKKFVYYVWIQSPELIYGAEE